MQLNIIFRRKMYIQFIKLYIFLTPRQAHVGVDVEYSLRLSAEEVRKKTINGMLYNNNNVV